jgi:antitoxin (DNA-binding transcriptional repressor) of toxin-antitoxin stability system
MMKKTVTTDELYDQLFDLIDCVESGDEVRVTRENEPIMLLVPYNRAAKDRKAGTAKEKIDIKPDFDDPLPDEFHGGL